MIDVILDALGYTGSDLIIQYIVIAFACVLVCGLAYALFDFVTSLVTALVGRNKKS